jgi:hypothetical protein
MGASDSNDSGDEGARTNSKFCADLAASDPMSDQAGSESNSNQESTTVVRYVGDVAFMSFVSLILMRY